jgi:hypothetical protein
MVFQDLDYDAGYQFRCGFTDQESAPAYRWDHGDERIGTSSLTDLLSAVAEAFESGAFRSKDLGGLNTDDKVWNAILLRNHPDRVRGVNALLHRQWSELNGEQLRGAFQDLVRINHSETAALVREYLSRELDQLVHDFETFYTSVSAGISIQDEWTRDFMLRLAFSDDSQIRQTALTSLAWSWRGELRLTAQHVDRLINMTRQPSDHNNRERAMLLGMSGDHRAVPALLRIIDDQSGGRDARIAALRALGRLRAVEARQVCLTVAQTDSDPGTRISAVSALIDLGFEDEPVERAAKAYFREMLRQSGSVATQSESPTLKRWLEEAKRSTRNDGVL